MNPLHVEMVDVFRDANKALAFLAPNERIFFRILLSHCAKLFSFMFGFFGTKA